jgi:hypothetical protein
MPTPVVRSLLLSLLLLGGGPRRLPGIRPACAAEDDVPAAAKKSTATTATATADVAAASDVLVRTNPGDSEGERLPAKSKSDDQARLEGGPVDHGRELLKWVERTDGAYFHPHLTIRRMGSGGTSSSTDEAAEQLARNASQAAAAAASSSSPFYGMYAVDDIASGELLLEIPRSMVFHPDEPASGDRVVRYYPENDQYYPGTLRHIHKDGTYTIEYDDDDEPETGVDPEEVSHEDYPSCCATVHKLVREMRLGATSFYGPYVRYLLSQPSGQLPTSWSPQGQALLKLVLGIKPKGKGEGELLSDDDEEEQLIQPYGSFGWIEEDWHGRCKGGKDALSEQAYLLLAQRGWDEVMIPGTLGMLCNSAVSPSTSSHLIFRRRSRIPISYSQQSWTCSATGTLRT